MPGLNASHEPTLDLKNRHLAALLAWLVPGLGHYYQGRRGKAVLYFVCIVGLFVTGQILGDWRNVFWRWTSPTQDAENFRFSYLCQFFVGLPALPALLQATLRHYGMGPILGGFLAEPALNDLNGLHARLGNLVEVGWVYTVVAGLLNVLAIYDALEGPALPDEASPQVAVVGTGTPAAGISTEGRA